MEKGTELTTFSPERLISQAIENKTDVQTMERLLAMRTQLKAEQAKEAYDIAMSKFQGECPVIKKIKAGGQTNSGIIAYYYAPLDAIVEQTRALIEKNGFSYSFKSETTEKGINVTCIITHNSGHSETTNISVPFGKATSVMSQPQVVMSAMTFAKRYAFCNGFGILTGDEDNDGQTGQKEEGKKEVKEEKKTEQKTEVIDIIKNKKCLSALNQVGDTEAAGILESKVYENLPTETLINGSIKTMADIITYGFKTEEDEKIINDYLKTKKELSTYDLKFMGLVGLYNKLAKQNNIPEIILEEK